MLTLEKFTLCGIDTEKANRILSVIQDKRDLSEYHIFFDSDIEKNYPNTANWVRHCHTMPTTVEIKLEMINEIMAGYGVEALSEESWDTYRYPHYSYVNMGDTYSTTMLYDYARDKWILSSWGDIAERFPNE